MTSRIAIDSNITTYFIQANLVEWDPKEDLHELAQEKIAAVRIFLYTKGTFEITPTAKQQIKQIRDKNWLREHNDTISNNWDDFPFQFSENQIEERKNYYFQFHKGGRKEAEDCRILAEAEIGDQRFGKCDVLLTFDKDFLKNLKDKTKTLKLMSPSDFWRELNIPKGSEPIKWFHTTNPNLNRTWWRW